MYSVDALSIPWTSQFTYMRKQINLLVLILPRLAPSASMHFQLDRDKLDPTSARPNTVTGEGEVKRSAAMTCSINLALPGRIPIRKFHCPLVLFPPFHGLKLHER